MCTLNESLSCGINVLFDATIHSVKTYSHTAKPEMYFIAGSRQKCPAVKKILPADKV